jgi:hypothetical protein
VHGDDAGVEVDVFPAQPGQLAGPQAQDEPEDPQGFEPVGLGDLEHGGDLGHGQGHGGALGPGGSFDQIGDVAVYLASALGPPQRPGQGGVDADE